MPPTGMFASAFFASSTELVGGSTSDARSFWKTISPTRSRRWYASVSSDMIAPLVACIRSETAMLHDASTAKRMRLEARRTRTLRCKSALAQGIGHAGILSSAVHAPCWNGAAGPQRGIKGDVVVPAVGGTCLNVTPTFALGARLRTSPGPLPCQLVEGGIQFARRKFRAGFDLFAALPPVGILVVENILRAGVGLAVIRQFFAATIGYGLAFFFDRLLVAVIRLLVGLVAFAPFRHDLFHLLFERGHAHLGISKRPAF